jgi:hypothetical protein
MHGLPWNRETTFHLRAYRYIFHILSQGIGKEAIQLMTAVITNILTQQAGTDAQFNLFH